MTTNFTTTKINDENIVTSINLENVVSVYSGRRGCCCGCRGKHTYAKAHQAYGSQHRGYAVGDDEVNDRTVKLIVNKVLATRKATADSDHIVAVEVGEYNKFASRDNRRTYVVYFKEGN